MNCDHIKDLLYEFITKRLSWEDSHLVKEHLSTCKSCQADWQDLEKTVSLLGEWTPPELSPYFKERVMGQIEERMAERRKPMFQKFIDLFQPYHFKIPAVVVMVLLVSTISIVLISKEDKVKTVPREFEISPEVIEAKRPIAVEVEDIDSALAQLSEIVQSHNGRLIRRRRVNSRMEVTFKIEESEEESLFRELHQLGKISLAKEGYKDGEGNVVVVLQKESQDHPGRDER